MSPLNFGNSKLLLGFTLQNPKQQTTTVRLNSVHIRIIYVDKINDIRQQENFKRLPASINT